MHRTKASNYLSLLVFFCLCTALASLDSHPAQAQNIRDSSTSFTDVVKKAGPAVVHVKVEKPVASRNAIPHEFFNDPFFEHFFGPQFRQPRSRQPEQRKRKQEGAGSGFIVDKKGYILTNNHVIEGAEKITVRLSDKREFIATVVGADPQSDVAVIKIDGKNLPTIPLGDSDALEVGEWVIAIGSPFELNHTVTVGVVSAKGRNRMGITDYENFIQTDAAINPGNSGGPLLNIRGEAIGMNTAIFSRSGGYMGIGFAIPINMAKSIEQQLRQSGTVTRGWLGIFIQDVDDDMAKSFGGKKGGGALISEVSENSPAQKQGLKPGDIIITIDDTPVTDVADLRNRIAMIAPNTKVKLHILRDQKEMNLTITIGEQPKDAITSASGDVSASLLAKVGITVQDLSKDVAEQFGYKMGQGVLIADVKDDSLAAMAGLKSGHLIEEINRIRVRNIKDVQEVMKKSGNKKNVLLRVRAGDRSQYIVLRTE